MMIAVDPAATWPPTRASSPSPAARTPSTSTSRSTRRRRRRASSSGLTTRMFNTVADTGRWYFFVLLRNILGVWEWSLRKKIVSRVLYQWARAETPSHRNIAVSKIKLYCNQIFCGTLNKFSNEILPPPMIIVLWFVTFILAWNKDAIRVRFFIVMPLELCIFQTKFC